MLIKCSANRPLKIIQDSVGAPQPSKGDGLSLELVGESSFKGLAYNLFGLLFKSLGGEFYFS